MPLYQYKCPSCGRKFDRFLALANYRDPVQCDCGAEVTEKLLAAPAVRGDYQGYNCPVTGTWIEGRRAHEENLKRHGCRILEPGERETNVRRVAAEDAALDASVEETVDRFVETLPVQKREQLVAEMENGLDVTVERQ